MNTKIFASLVLAAALSTWAGDWAVVVNPAVGAASVSKADLKRIFTGKKGTIGSAKVVPIMLAESNPAAVAFLKEVLGMTPEEYKKYWIDAQIKGQGTAPMTQKTPAAAVAVAGELPGALAVVAPGAANASVKELKVE